MSALRAAFTSGCRDTEDTIPSDRFPSAAYALRHTSDTEPAPPARDSFPTTPYNRTPSQALPAQAGHHDALDEQTTDSGRPMPEWCVDLGDRLTAFTTFELWMGLARGEISPQTRVWRDNMEAWTKVEDIPELAYATADSISLDPPVVTPAPLAEPLKARSEVRTPLTFASTDTADQADLEQVPTTSEPIRIPLRSGPKLGFTPSKRGALSFALGCAVAITALTLAMVRTSGRSPVPSATLAQGAGGTRQRLEARLDELTGETSRVALQAAARRQTPLLAPQPPSARHHQDPGQRRSRRSSRR